MATTMGVKMGHDPWVDPIQVDPLTQMNCLFLIQLVNMIMG